MLRLGSLGDSAREQPSLLGRSAARRTVTAGWSRLPVTRPTPAAVEGEVPEQQLSYCETENIQSRHSGKVGTSFSFTSAASASFLLSDLGTDEEYSDDSLHDWLIHKLHKISLVTPSTAPKLLGIPGTV